MGKRKERKERTTAGHDGERSQSRHEGPDPLLGRNSGNELDKAAPPKRSVKTVRSPSQYGYKEPVIGNDAPGEKRTSF